MQEFTISNSGFPPGVRFHPSDQELVSYYLHRKVKSLPLPANVITDIDLYTYDPWDLPRNTVFGEEESYFFTPRDRKYPNGGRPNRAAASGYWKATGTDQPIRSSFGSRIIGVKKPLVFYRGRPPTGHRMDWVMTEYRLPDTARPSRSTGSMRLDDWVLCRIRQKGNMSKNEISDEQHSWSSEIVRRRESPDMLSEYLRSNEYKLIVSLLAGHDPSTVFQSSFGSESSPSKESVISYEQTDFDFQSGSLVVEEDAGSYGQHACFGLQEFDFQPAMQHNFMQ